MDTWAAIEGWPYEVSANGEVRSSRRRVASGTGWRIAGGTLLRQVLGACGYNVVSLSNGKAQKKQVLVHRLVAIAFLGNPGEPYEVAHTDGDRQNNRVENLRWVTALENAADRARHGRTARGPMAERRARRMKELERQGLAQPTDRTAPSPSGSPCRVWQRTPRA